MAKIIKGLEVLESEDLKKKLKEHIDQNNLIGLPTETVYGLGGNSLNENSLKKIFKMKNRPVSDPIISHVYDISQAFEQLYHINIFEKYIIYILNKYFWPGPLSIIAKAKKNVPLILTAHTKFCAVRIPNNMIAREIIKVCETPIAAPSANKFQHISPTNSLHVYEEFQDENILIFDDGQCDIGIESTVLKVTKYKKKKNYTIYNNDDRDINIEINSKQGKDVSCNSICDNINDDDTVDEVITDDEYEKECEEEEKKFQNLINSKEFDLNLKNYDKLKNIFDNIESEEEQNKYTYEKILKYKNLYNYRIIIYRRGKYTKNDIEKVLKNNKLLNNIKVDLYKKIKFENLEIFQNKNKRQNDDDNMNVYKNCDTFKSIDNINSEDLDTQNKYFSKESEINKVSPGLLLTHYSPVVSTYLIDITSEKRKINSSNKLLNIQLKKCIFLDIGNSFFKFQDSFLKYINICYDNLSEEEQIKHITKTFFLYLRQAEALAIKHEAENILISIYNLKLSEEKHLSIFDRIFRSASGKILKAFINNDEFRIFNN